MIKEQIINTAFDLFSQYGIKSVSMDDVAKAAGISKRTLYESFEDKETLLIEGIDHNYCCPIKLLKRDKFRTDSFAGVSPFWLFSCRQTKPNNQCAKIVILADSRSMVR